MVLAGSRIGSGSSVTASEETLCCISRVGRGHVCPRTTVSVTASRMGKIDAGQSSGALETHYHLEATADAVLTPDSALLAVGNFDYAIATNSHGDTCVVPCSEIRLRCWFRMMATHYQVSLRQVVFRKEGWTASATISHRLRMRSAAAADHARVDCASDHHRFGREFARTCTSRHRP